MNTIYTKCSYADGQSEIGIMQTKRLTLKKGEEEKMAKLMPWVQDKDYFTHIPKNTSNKFNYPMIRIVE